MKLYKYLNKRNKLFKKLEKLKKKGYIKQLTYKYNDDNHIYEVVIKLIWIGGNKWEITLLFVAVLK